MRHHMCPLQQEPGCSSVPCTLCFSAQNTHVLQFCRVDSARAPGIPSCHACRETGQDLRGLRSHFTKQLAVRLPQVKFFTFKWRSRSRNTHFLSPNVIRSHLRQKLNPTPEKIIEAERSSCLKIIKAERSSCFEGLFVTDPTLRGAGPVAMV